MRLIKIVAFLVVASMIWAPSAAAKTKLIGKGIRTVAKMKIWRNHSSSFLSLSPSVSGYGLKEDEYPAVWGLLGVDQVVHGKSSEHSLHMDEDMKQGIECGLSTLPVLAHFLLDTRGREKTAPDQKKQLRLPTSCGDVVEILGVLSSTDGNRRPVDLSSRYRSHHTVLPGSDKSLPRQIVLEDDYRRESCDTMLGVRGPAPLPLRIAGRAHAQSLRHRVIPPHTAGVAGFQL